MNKQIYYMAEVCEEIACEKLYDYFILAPNIEERSKACFLKYKEYFTINNVVLMDYSNFHKKILELQEKTFFDEFQDCNYLMLWCESDADAVRKLCDQNFSEDNKIAIDITGFSIPNIYGILHALKNIIGVKSVDIYYTEPQFYVYDKGYYDAYHTHINLKERKCEPIVGFYSSGKNESEILTIFLGFDGGLADFVYFKLGEESQETIDTLIVNGFPAYTPKLKDVSLLNNFDFITEVGQHKVYNASANNPFSSYNLLCDFQKRYNDTLLNICTIGSKPMALGACLFALNYGNRVKVTYPYYEKVYFDASEKAGKTWLYQLYFNEI